MLDFDRAKSGVKSILTYPSGLTSPKVMLEGGVRNGADKSPFNTTFGGVMMSDVNDLTV